MDNSMFGLSEIYNLIIKADYDIKVGSRTIEAGEPIAVFEKIQVANLKEVVQRVSADGGYENTPRVIWESTKGVNLHFTQGIFSKIHLAVLGNAELNSAESYEVPKEELGIEVQEGGQVELKEVPSSDLFVYLRSTGEKLKYQLNEKTVVVDGIEDYSLIDVYYNFNKVSSTSVVSIGKRLLTGFLTVQAKTRLKNDSTGQVVTGVLKIPKAQLLSEFVIQLGSKTPPSIGNFHLQALPTGAKGSQTVMDFIMLDDDIDSDIQ